MNMSSIAKEITVNGQTYLVQQYEKDCDLFDEKGIFIKTFKDEKEAVDFIMRKT